MGTSICIKQSYFNALFRRCNALIVLLRSDCYRLHITLSLYPFTEYGCKGIPQKLSGSCTFETPTTTRQSAAYSVVSSKAPENQDSVRGAGDHPHFTSDCASTTTACEGLRQESLQSPHALQRPDDKVEHQIIPYRSIRFSAPAHRTRQSGPNEI